MKFDFQALLTAKYAKWLIIGFIAIFSILIIYEYASLFFTSRPTSVATANEKGLSTNSKEDSSQYILKSSLFGVYVPNDIDGSDVKKSMLDVTLVGILFANIVDESQVIIKASNDEEKTYKVGDSVPGGAVIKKIMANGVLVEHNGALESLSLPKAEITYEPQAKPLQQDE